MSSNEDDYFAETYRSYKISTDYFLNWLWSQHEGLVPKPASVPRTTKGMLTVAKALSQTLKKNKHSVPASVISSLRNAISKRREALAIYEELGADDINHGVFIQRLEQTLSILTPFMATSLAPAAVAINTDKDYTTNAFASLATLADELDSDSLDPTSTISEPAPLLAQGPYAVVAPFEFMLEDDELSERVEIMAIVQIWAVVEIFKNIKRDVIQGRAISGLESYDQVLDCPSERILPLALENISELQNPASLELALGMDIFLSSYEAFLWADGKQNRQNCRLQALLLAKDMQKSILSSIGSLKKLACDMSFYSMPIVFQKELYDLLDAYLCEKAFDLYHQAPWTAGGDAHNAGSQFHRELIQKVRVGQLKTVFRHQIANDYIIHPEYLAMVFGERPDLARTEPVRSRIRGMADKSDVFDMMEKSKELVLPEFRGRLPTARLDMFKVFTTCVAVLEKFSIIVQGQHKAGGVEFHVIADNHIIKGSAMVDIVLGFIVQFSGDKQKEEMLQDLSLPTAAAWAFFIEVDHGAKLEHYLWNI
ncbi:hypothetical protein K4K60_012172 [Colletotrichum sp. SAR11_57]|nr:hypothetical protein K4K60_012172 [Colletotrichum sp. SAR11_57]